MIIIIKKKLDGEYLGFEVKEFFDKSEVRVDLLYQHRMILEVREVEIPEFECVVYEITLSNEVHLDD